MSLFTFDELHSPTMKLVARPLQSYSNVVGPPNLFRPLDLNTCVPSSKFHKRLMQSYALKPYHLLNTQHSMGFPKKTLASVWNLLQQTSSSVVTVSNPQKESIISSLIHCI